MIDSLFPDPNRREEQARRVAEAEATYDEFEAKCKSNLTARQARQAADNAPYEVFKLKLLTEEDAAYQTYIGEQRIFDERIREARHRLAALLAEFGVVLE